MQTIPVTSVMAKEFLLIDGRKLARARGRKLLAQIELAKMSGVAEGTIKKVEPKASVPIQFRNARKLAAALGMSDDQFIAEISAEQQVSRITIVVDDAQILNSLNDLAASEGTSVEEMAMQILRRAAAPRLRMAAARRKKSR
jgi:transcriptional regulator with XRE-family HTH domain